MMKNTKMILLRVWYPIKFGNIYDFSTEKFEHCEETVPIKYALCQMQSQSSWKRVHF